VVDYDKHLQHWRRATNSLRRGTGLESSSQNRHPPLIEVGGLLPHKRLIQQQESPSLYELGFLAFPDDPGMKI